MCLGKISHDNTVRYNTNTKRLTTEMFYKVFADVREFVDLK